MGENNEFTTKCEPEVSGANCRGGRRFASLTSHFDQVLFALPAAELSLQHREMLLIEASFKPAFSGLGLDSFAAAADFFLRGKKNVSPKMTVLPVELHVPGQGVVHVFYKHYQPARPKWEFIGRRSKARCEFENYAVFSRLGIPAPDRIAVGEERDRIGRLLRTLIITRAVPGALTLTEFVKKYCPNRRTRESRSLRVKVCRDVAQLTRQAHQAGFYHNDLFWRNVLVTWQPPSDPKVWWLDCPRGGFTRVPIVRERRRLKDLASLDKLALRHCTDGERLSFVKAYLGKSRVDEEVRRLVRKEVAYHRRRWPEDWNGH